MAKHIICQNGARYTLRADFEALELHPTVMQALRGGDRWPMCELVSDRFGFYDKALLQSLSAFEYLQRAVAFVHGGGSYFRLTCGLLMPAVEFDVEYDIDVKKLVLEVNGETAFNGYPRNFDPVLCEIWALYMHDVQTALARADAAIALFAKSFEP